MGGCQLSLKGVQTQSFHCRFNPRKCKLVTSYWLIWIRLHLLIKHWRRQVLRLLRLNRGGVSREGSALLWEWTKETRTEESFLTGEMEFLGPPLRHLFFNALCSPRLRYRHVEAALTAATRHCNTWTSPPYWRGQDSWTNTISSNVRFHIDIKLYYLYFR